MQKQVWVSPDGNGWKVQSAGSEKAYRHTERKAEAVTLGNSVAENNRAELIVQNKDGEIGHWEGDTIRGKEKTAGIATYV